MDLSRRALCAAARLRHRCRNVGGMLGLAGGGRREADFLLRWQDDEEEVKNQMNWFGFKGVRQYLKSPLLPVTSDT